MLTVTTAAKEYLVALKRQTKLAHRDMALRIVAGPLGQLGLVLDVQHADDHVIEHEGTKALLVGGKAAKPLARAVIDARRGPGGTRLVLCRLLARGHCARTGAVSAPGEDDRRGVGAAPGESGGQVGPPYGEEGGRRVDPRVRDPRRPGRSLGVEQSRCRTFDAGTVRRIPSQCADC